MGVINRDVIELFNNIRAEVHDIKDVRKFHNKFGHLDNHTPVHLTKRKLLERIKFLQEELDEFTEGCGFKRTHDIWSKGDYYEDTGSNQDLALQADSLVDLVYVALGSAAMMGLPWITLWDDVQRANMAKVPGVSHRGNLIDCVKPEGWQGPYTLNILTSYGYDISTAAKPEEHKDDECHLQKTDNI